MYQIPNGVAGLRNQQSTDCNIRVFDFSSSLFGNQLVGH